MPQNSFEQSDSDSGALWFKALLNMDGLGDLPTFEAILRNDLGGVPVWALITGNVGWSLTLAGAFPANQTLVTTGVFYGTNNYFFFNPLIGTLLQPDSLNFECGSGDPTADQFPLIIEVFPAP